MAPSYRVKWKISFLFLLLSGSLFSQSFKPKQVKVLSQLGIDTTAMRTAPVQAVVTLNQILKKEHQRKANKTTAIVFSSLSAFYLATGTYFLLKPATGEEAGINPTIGGILISGGVIMGGISVPFWIISNKRKKQRDKLLQAYP